MSDQPKRRRCAFTDGERGIHYFVPVGAEAFCGRKCQRADDRAGYEGLKLNTIPKENSNVKN